MQITHLLNSRFQISILKQWFKNIKILSCVVIGAWLLIITLQPARGESLSVSLQVGSTQVTFSGYTSPNSFVVIKEGMDVVGTSTSNSVGDWSTTINVAIPNIHAYTIYSTDSASRQSSSVEYSLNVSGNTTTTIDHIVLPPTISLADTLLTGATHPTATLTLTISSGDTAAINPDSAGFWSYDLALLPPGSYSLSMTATVPPSYLSVASYPISFTTLSPSPSPSPNSSLLSPSPTPTTSPMASLSPLPNSPSPSPRPFFIAIYDTNHDGKLTKLELIDIIKAWLRKFLICDLNHDTQCNLIDLSILLYYIDR